MKCPKCNREIRNINVTSICWQKATVNKDGGIEEYGVVEEVLETTAIEHGDNGCLYDLSSILKA